MMLTRIQTQLVHQELKLLLQNSQINDHKFIASNAVGMSREYNTNVFKPLSTIPFHQADITVAVVQVGQHIPEAQILKLFLSVLHLHPVHDEKLDGGQKLKIPVMLPRIVHTEKTGDHSVFLKGNDNLAVDVLCL